MTKHETWECDACGSRAEPDDAMRARWFVVTVTRHNPWQTVDFHACCVEHVQIGVSKRSESLTVR